MKSYKNISDPQRSFVTEYVEKHTEKNTFFKDIKKLIDWVAIDQELKKVYTKGLTDRGAKAYSPLLLFKMHLISIWYELSDTQTEAMANDSLSVMKFCNLTIEDPIPGHGTISRFKKELFDKNVHDQLVEIINQQLADAGLKIVKGKAKVDARIARG